MFFLLRAEAVAEQVQVVEAEEAVVVVVFYHAL
jgi:hypothetical protein